MDGKCRKPVAENRGILPDNAKTPAKSPCLPYMEKSFEKSN